MPMRRVAVLTAPEAGDPDRAALATRVARLLADNGFTLVCHGDAAGPSAVLSDAATARGGRVEGIVVDGAAAHAGLSEVVRVRSAAERDTELTSRADAFFALPGAFRSLGDLFALWPEGAPATQGKPCGLLNAGDYYTGLLRVADDDALDRFVRESQRGMVILDRDPEILLRTMADYRPPETRRLEPRDEEW